jgi:hypothetical protein
MGQHFQRDFALEACIARDTLLPSRRRLGR